MWFGACSWSRPWLPPRPPHRPTNTLSAPFRWTYGPPLVAPASRPADPCYSVKDPSIVRYDGRWHLFCTIRSVKRTHQIEYSHFADWKDADAAERHILTVSDGYFCARRCSGSSRTASGTWSSR